MPTTEIALASATLAQLATLVGTGAASAAGADLWQKAKSRLGFESDPTPTRLAHELVSALAADPSLANELLGLLESQLPPSDGGGRVETGPIRAKTVVNIGRSGDVRI